jgi:hypothetical protein
MALNHSPNSLHWNVRGFDLDSTLPAGPAWDPATGPGVPNGAAFVRPFGRHNLRKSTGCLITRAALHAPAA